MTSSRLPALALLLGSLLGCVVATSPDPGPAPGPSAGERDRPARTGLPVWYGDLTRWRKDHPGEYVVGISAPVIDEHEGDANARASAQQKVAAGEQLHEEAFFFLDSEGRPIATFDSVFGFKRVVVLYRVGAPSPAAPEPGPTPPG